MRMYRSGDGPLDGMIESLFSDAEAPPKEVKGVSQDFLDELERVPNKLLKKSMDCPICGNPFLEGDFFPLMLVCQLMSDMLLQMNIRSSSASPAIRTTCLISSALHLG